MQTVEFLKLYFEEYIGTKTVFFVLILFLFIIKILFVGHGKQDFFISGLYRQYEATKRIRLRCERPSYERFK